MNTLPPEPTADCTRKPGAQDTKCRCSQACLSLSVRARRARQKRQKKGGTGFYSAEMMASHVSRLLAAAPGSTSADVARASGVSRKTIHNLLKPGTRRASVYPKTAKRLLQVRRLPETVEQEAVPGKVARRMIEALATQGYSSADVSKQCGLKPSTLSPSRGERIGPEARARVAKAYETLRYTEGPSRTAQERARNRGCAPWSAWVPSVKDPNARIDLSLMTPSSWRDAIEDRLEKNEYPLV